MVLFQDKKYPKILTKQSFHPPYLNANNTSKVVDKKWLYSASHNVNIFLQTQAPLLYCNAFRYSRHRWPAVLSVASAPTCCFLEISILQIKTKVNKEK